MYKLSVVQCLLFCMSLSVCLSNISVCDAILDESAYGYNLQYFNTTKEAVAHGLDFNADRSLDLLVDDGQLFYGSLAIALNKKEPNFFRSAGRYSLSIDNTDWSDTLAYALIPTQKNDIVLVSGDSMQILVYLKDEISPVIHHYKAYTSLLKLNLPEDPTKFYTTIHQIAIADVMGPWNDYLYSDLMVVSSAKDGDTRLFIFSNPFEIIADRREPLIPMQVISLPGVPTRLYADQITNDSKADLFFEYDGMWYIWLSNNNGGGFEPDNPERSFQIPIPSGVKRALDAGYGVQGYRWFVSVESEPDSDVAYIAFPDEHLDEPVTVTIPNKHTQGLITRMFRFQKGEPSTGYPLFIVYNPLDDENLQDSAFYLYQEMVRAMPSDEPLNPILLQTFHPKNITRSDQAVRYYLDRPEMLDDIDLDGTSDMIFKAAILQTSDESFRDRYTFLGYAGIGKTNISNWSVYEYPKD